MDAKINDKIEKYEPQKTMPAVLIEKAISGNADLDKLEKLLELQERWERNEAKKDYVVAMAAFKASPPRIDKDRYVNYGTTEYSYASIANVCEKISKALSRHGLSAAWSTSQAEKTISVTCTITHEFGHSESTTLSAAPDTSGSKNSIQAIGSTISYLERYTILALTGLATHDMDVDGGLPDEYEKISKDQALTIRALIEEVGGKEETVATYYKIESVEDLPAEMFERACKAIERKRK